MANTDVTLINAGGIYMPSVASVPVVSGDTVSFSTDDGSAAVAFFSPDAIAVLSPKPASAFPIGSNGKAVFTFLSSNPGAYSAYFGSDSNSGPARFPSGTSQTLLLEIQAPEPPPFSGPGDTMGTGHGG